MKKKIIIGFLVAMLICAAGFGLYSLYNRYSSSENGPVVNNGGLEVDYPTGDKIPEHLAEVLGSYSAYVELRDSKLLKPVYEKVGDEVVERCSMQIVYDVYRDQKVFWVAMVMRGEVVEIEGRVITVANEGETIFLYVPEFTAIQYVDIWQLPLREAKFEDIKVGDWFPHISVVINADRSEARAIDIAIGS